MKNIIVLVLSSYFVLFASERKHFCPREEPSTEIDFKFKAQRRVFDSVRRLYKFETENLVGPQRAPVPSKTREDGTALVFSLPHRSLSKTVLTSTVQSFPYLPDIAIGTLCGIVVGGVYGNTMGGAALGSVIGGAEYMWRSSTLNTQERLHKRNWYGSYIDRRKKVSNAHEFPWRVHGHMEMVFPYGAYIGSGTLIDGEYVLTAAHNLYDRKSGVEVVPSGVSFYPGISENSIPFGGAVAENICIHPLYAKARMPFEENMYDVGVVKLKKPEGKSKHLGEILGYYGMKVLSDRKTVTVSGYPGSPGNGRDMYYMSGEIKDFKAAEFSEFTSISKPTAFEENTFFYDIDTSPGQSGSSVWINDGGYDCVGIHAYGYSNYNGGTKITKDLLKKINEWTSYDEKGRGAVSIKDNSDNKQTSWSWKWPWKSN